MYENQCKLACVPVAGSAITAAVFLLPVGYKESSPTCHPPLRSTTPILPTDIGTSEHLPEKFFKAENIVLNVFLILMSVAIATIKIRSIFSKHRFFWGT